MSSPGPDRGRGAHMQTVLQSPWIFLPRGEENRRRGKNEAPPRVGHEVRNESNHLQIYEEKSQNTSAARPIEGAPSSQEEQQPPKEEGMEIKVVVSEGLKHYLESRWLCCFNHT